MLDDSVMDLSRAASEMGKKGGKSRSLAKKLTARENGKLGGRPKKNRKRS